MQISTYKSQKRTNKHKKTVFMLKKGLDEKNSKSVEIPMLTSHF